MPKIIKQTSRAAPVKATNGKLQSDNAWDLTDALKVLVYGESGSGKTTFWSTFPGPILVAVCSGGSRPGELRSIDTPEMRAKITPRIVRSTDAIKGMIDEAESDFAGGTFVLDHGSGLQDLTLKEILGLAELPAQKGWGMATQQQYGQSSLMCKEIFRAMLSLPCNVVIVAQQRTFGNSDDANVSDLIKPTVGAAMTPSVTGWLGPACDYVVQMYKRARMITKENTVGGKKMTRIERGKGVEYCLRTEPHDVFMTKFRVPKGRVLPECIVDPTFIKMKAIIEGK